MLIKKMTVAASMMLGMASQVLANEYNILLDAVDQSLQEVQVMTSVIQGGEGGPVDSQSNGDLGGGSMPNFPTNGGGSSDCTFCLTNNLVDEGDVNAALGILQEVGQSLFRARNHILALPTSTGTNYNYNKSFACSYMGDASIDIGSASLTLGYPQNLNPQWKSKEQSSVFRIDRARQQAGCP